MIQRVLIWLSVVFAIFFMAYKPDGAAAVVKAIGAGLMAIFQGFADFFTSLVV